MFFIDHLKSDFIPSYFEYHTSENNFEFHQITSNSVTDKASVEKRISTACNFIARSSTVSRRNISAKWNRIVHPDP